MYTIRVELGRGNFSISRASSAREAWDKVVGFKRRGLRFAITDPNDKPVSEAELQASKNLP
jgi:hypothetical protein